MERRITNPHVLYVENSPGFGGSTRCVLELAGSCVQSGGQATIVLANALPPGEILPEGVQVISLGRSGAIRKVRSNADSSKRTRTPVAGSMLLRLWNRMGAVQSLLLHDWPAARRLAAYACAKGVHLIHANNELLANRVGVAAGRLAGLPVISHQRGWARSCPMTRLLSGSVQRFVAISQAIKQDLLRVGVPSERVVQIYDGVNLNPSWTAPEARSTLRRSYGWTEGELVIGFPAVITGWKGHALFLNAFAHLSRQLPHARALLVGDPLPTELSYLQALRVQASQLGIADKVVFTGHVRSMGPFYLAMDMVVHGSLAAEPLGLVVLEAMVMGRPVIAANAGGPAEIITPEHDGLLYSMGDEAALREALFRLAGDPILRERLGQAGMARGKAFHHHSCWSAIADLYADVLCEWGQRTRGFFRWRSNPFYSSSVSSPRASAPSTFR